MKRRHFLGATATGLAATAWPAFIEEAFGDSAAGDGSGPPSDPAAKATALEAALRRARQAKRPLLVFVIPAKDGEKWERGRAFGELLNHGADKDLAPLSDAEVVCATMSDLKKVVPVAGDAEPMMVLVKTDTLPVAARPLDITLPDYPDWQSGTGWDQLQKEEEQVAARRIDAMGGLLRSALGSDGRKLAARAAGVRARLVKKPVPGAHWASGGGCGTTIEGVEQSMSVACGMGHVPAKSTRFLYFFAVQSRRP